MLDDILRDLIDKVPGARGAIFCDGEGEAVSSVGASGRVDVERLDDYELRCTGAQFATPLHFASEKGGATFGSVLQCVIVAERETLIIQMLPESYYFVVCLEPGAVVAVAMQHVRFAAQLLASEIV